MLLPQAGLPDRTSDLGLHLLFQDPGFGSEPSRWKGVAPFQFASSHAHGFFLCKIKGWRLKIPNGLNAEIFPRTENIDQQSEGGQGSGTPAQGQMLAQK